MLSILIPVYNTLVTELVIELDRLGDRLLDPFEIIVLDDASEQRYREMNSKIESLKSVKYVTGEKNIGRSAARNQLARMARFPYLLFIDADAKILNGNFLNFYRMNCRTGIVLCGGTAYSKLPPAEKEFYLRWKYGRKRESRHARKRNFHPNRGFSSFNFLIDKNLFVSLEFPETLNLYGHEDTQFGYLLWKKGIKIHHADNPLLHTGMEPAELFCKKTRTGLENLYRLTIENGENPDFIKFSRLLKMFYWLKKIRILPLPYRISKSAIPFLEKRLANPKPKLLFFDLYKLLHYSLIHFNRGQE